MLETEGAVARAEELLLVVVIVEPSEYELLTEAVKDDLLSSTMELDREKVELSAEERVVATDIVGSTLLKVIVKLAKVDVKGEVLLIGAPEEAGMVDDTSLLETEFTAEELSRGPVAILKDNVLASEDFTVADELDEVVSREIVLCAGVVLAEEVILVAMLAP